MVVYRFVTVLLKKKVSDRRKSYVGSIHFAFGLLL